jgi:outer membrane protein OmpA-like peptidoglycan-associated protein
LERLAALLQEHPEYTHVEVQGHTDRRGSEAFNKKLSQDRADSVMAFLIKHGIEAERLTAIGKGSDEPRAEADNSHAWFLNRRVEFLVTRKPLPDAEPVAGPAAKEAASDDESGSTEPDAPQEPAGP